MTTTEPRSVLAALSDGLAGAVQQASAGVVTVDARRRIGATGVVWPDPRVVVTADHVLERDDNIGVVLADGSRVAATIAGRDPSSDVAILRLDPAPSVAVRLAPPDAVRVGHIVLALGRPGSEGIMASFGVVSALGGTWRTARGGVIEGYIRADVALYPGFSGGPLIDTQGRMVGLNSYYLARGQEIALPTAAVARIVTALLAEGRIRRPYLGVTSQPVQLPAAIRQAVGAEQATGLMLVGVEAGSPADRAGLMIGDVLVGLGGRRITDPEDLRAALAAEQVGRPTSVVVVRGGQRHELTVTPGERST